VAVTRSGEDLASAWPIAAPTTATPMKIRDNAQRSARFNHAESPRSPVTIPFARRHLPIRGKPRPSPAVND